MISLFAFPIYIPQADEAVDSAFQQPNGANNRFELSMWKTFENTVRQWRETDVQLTSLNERLRIQ